MKKLVLSIGLVIISIVNVFSQSNICTNASKRFINNIRKYRLDNNIESIHNTAINDVKYNSKWTLVLSDSIQKQSGITFQAAMGVDPSDIISVVDSKYADLMFNNMINTNNEFKQICQDLDIDNYIIGCIKRHQPDGTIFYVFKIFKNNF